MTPEIAGEWDLSGRALAPDGSELYQWEAHVTIRPDLSVTLQTRGERLSRSHSYAERASRLPDGRWKLTYGYEMEPNSGAPEGYEFFGMSQLTFAADLATAGGNSCNWNGTRYVVMELALTRASQSAAQARRRGARSRPIAMTSSTGSKPRRMKPVTPSR